MSNTPDSSDSTVAYNPSSQTTTPPVQTVTTVGPGSILDNCDIKSKRALAKAVWAKYFWQQNQGNYQRQVAIKMMLSPESESDNKRFELESQTVASFKDPHTFDYLTTESHQRASNIKSSNIYKVKISRNTFDLMVQSIPRSPNQSEYNCAVHSPRHIAPISYIETSNPATLC